MSDLQAAGILYGASMLMLPLLGRELPFRLLIFPYIACIFAGHFFIAKAVAIWIFYS